MVLLPQEREMVLQQTTRAVALELDNPEESYTVDRDGSAYVTVLLGLDSTIGYIAQLPHKLVVDIGCGTSEGISDLSQAYEGHSLQFRATALTHIPEHEQFFGRENIDITSVESLDPYDDNSVGCFLAVHSLGYSTLPRRAIETIFRKLTPGGVLKAVFRNQFEPNRFNEQPMNEFYDACIKVGLDTAPLYPDESGPEVLMAIKPTLRQNATARELVQQDFQEMMGSLRRLKEIKRRKLIT